MYYVGKGIMWQRAVAVLVFMLLCVNLLYVPVTAAAAEQMTAEEICAKLNYEIFTDEIYYAVTEKLDLASESVMNKLGVSGATVSWKSSRPEVISETGEVTRDKYRDQAVTLTATVEADGDKKSRDIDFVVLSEQAKIYTAENFNYDVENGTAITEATGNTDDDGAALGTGSASGWSFSSVDAVAMKAYVALEDSGNHVLKGYRNGTDAAAHYVRHVFDDKAVGEVVWEADVKFDRDKPPQVYMFEIYGTYLNSDNTKSRARIVDFDIRLNNDATRVSLGTGYWTAEETIRPTYASDALLSNEWSRIKIVMNTEKEEWAAYIKGEKIAENIPFYEKNKKGIGERSCLYVNDFCYGTYRNYEPDSNVYIDNLSLRKYTDYYSENAAAYEIADALSLDMLTSDGAETIENELDLSLTNFAAEIEENNISVSWQSSDESVLYVDGSTAVPVLGTINHEVVLTANIGGVSKSFELTVLAEEKYRAVNQVYDALSFECFTKEPQTAVTQNLDFSLENLNTVCSLDGVGLDFASSMPAVLSDNGEVKRQKQDTELTLSVTVSDVNGCTRIKEMPVVVLAEHKEVYYSSNFRYPELLGSSLDDLEGWSNSVTPSGFETTLVSENNNYLLSSYRETAGEDTNFAKLKISGACKTEFTVEARVKFEDGTKDSSVISAPVYVFELWGYYALDGKLSSERIAEIRFGYDVNNVRFSYFEDTKSTAAVGVPELGEWFNLKLECDVLKHTMDAYIDGVKINDEEIPFYKKDAEGFNAESFETVETLRYNSFRSKEKLGIKFDDVSITGKKVLHHVCELHEYNAAGEGGALKSVDYINYFDGNAIDARVWLANGSDSDKTFDVYLAVYDSGKLCDLRKSSEQITVEAGGNKMVPFPDIAWKADSDSLTIKSFVWDKDGLLPSDTVTEISGKVKKSYSPEIILKTETDREITYIDLFGEKAYKPYFSAQSWSADSKKLYFHGENHNIYEYNTETDEIRFISKSNTYYGFVTVPARNTLIYTNGENQIAEMNIDTYEKRLVAELPAEAQGAGSLLTVTNDGRYLSLLWSEDYSNFGDEGAELKYRRFPVLDVETGVWQESENHYHGFSDSPPYNTFINPVYSNLLFYCHADAANDERLWLINTDTDENYNMYIQKPYSSTLSGESVSHECWTHDGERMVMAVNKLDTRQIGPNGVVSINKEGKDRRVINSEYSYLHLGTSPVSDRWVIGDTAYNGIYTHIVLVDCYSGKAYKLATVNQNSSDSVAHGHPAFSPDGKKVYFGMYNEDYSSNGIGIIDVSDIVSSAPERTEITLSDNCRSESVPGFDYTLASVQAEGAAAYKIADGKHMNVNYTGEEKENAPATVTVEYYAGGGSMMLEYYKWTKYTDSEPSKLELLTKEVETETSGGWKTAVAILDDINLEGYGELGGDFAVKASGGDLIIKSVRVSVGSE